MRAPSAVSGRRPSGLSRFASDQRLIEQVRAGSDRAFETLFDRHHRSVLRFCAHMLGSRAEAEDAAQQTFLAAYRDLVRSAEPVALRPWLYGIARHRCLLALRDRGKRRVGVAPEPERVGDVTVEAGIRADVRAVMADVAQLPDEQRAALVLAELGDLSHEEIARVLGCHRQKVKALVFQARASLRTARDAREAPCAEIREQLATLRGSALLRATLRRHLDNCPDCRAYRDALRCGRQQLGARLPWAPAIALKRYIFGVFGTGGGAGSAALTGGALGGAGLAAAALVAVAIPVGGDAAAVTAARHRDEPVRPVTRATPARPVTRPVPVRPATRAASVRSAPRHAEKSSSSGHVRTRDAPGVARETGDDPDRTGRDEGATAAGEPPAPEEMVAEDEGRARDESAADDGDEAQAAEPLQPVAALPPPPSPSPGSTDRYRPAPTAARAEASRTQRPAPPPHGSGGVVPSSPPAAKDQHRPATPPRRANNHRPSVPPSRARSHAEPAGRHGDPHTPPGPTHPPAAAPPAVAQRPASEADARRGSPLADPDVPKGERHRQLGTDQQPGSETETGVGGPGSDAPGSRPSPSGGPAYRSETPVEGSSRSPGPPHPTPPPSHAGADAPARAHAV